MGYVSVGLSQSLWVLGDPAHDHTRPVGLRDGLRAPLQRAILT